MVGQRVEKELNYLILSTKGFTTQMGFGFNLLMILIIFPLTIILLLVWLVSRNMLFGKILGILWMVISGTVIFITTLNLLISKKVLEKNDYYGQYIIDRNFFPGKQADWQYDHFRFEILENDSIRFYVTDGPEILKTFNGVVSTTTPYKSARLKIEMQQPTHHILRYNPTTYRSTWDFYLVFYSPKFHNMYFKKGKWKRVD